MNNILDYTKCSNCGACYNACMNNAINVAKDGLFYKLTVDENKCTGCGICKKVCPVNNLSKKQNIKKAYALIHNNEDVVRRSSSGGAFTAIADWVLSEGGIVYGAVYSDNFREVKISSTENKILDELRRSKYVESQVEYSFRDIKKQLELSDKIILFCAAPCQIAGLKSFLKKEYSNLITCDFSCGGMTSHKIYAEYLSYIEKRLGSKICEVNFRPKIYGWSNHAIKIRSENGKEYKRFAKSDIYFDCFVGKNHHKIVRDYCLNCEFANNHYSDIIMADLWKYKTVSNIKNDDKGISLIITNSDLGEKIIKNISKKVALTILDTEKASYNLVPKQYSDNFRENRKQFLQKCKNDGFIQATRNFKLKSQLLLLIKYRIKKLIK